MWPRTEIKGLVFRRGPDTAERHNRWQILAGAVSNSYATDLIYHTEYEYLAGKNSADFTPAAFSLPLVQGVSLESGILYLGSR